VKTDGSERRVLTEDEATEDGTTDEIETETETRAKSSTVEALSTRTTSVLPLLRLLRFRGGIRRICTLTSKGGRDHHILVVRTVAAEGVSIWKGTSASIEISRQYTDCHSVVERKEKLRH
jgi:hypothetical protein